KPDGQWTDAGAASSSEHKRHPGAPTASPTSMPPLLPSATRQLDRCGTPASVCLLAMNAPGVSPATRPASVRQLPRSGLRSTRHMSLAPLGGRDGSSVDHVFGAGDG